MSKSTSKGSSDGKAILAALVIPIAIAIGFVIAMLTPFDAFGEYTRYAFCMVAGVGFGGVAGAIVGGTAGLFVFARYLWESAVRSRG